MEPNRAFPVHNLRPRNPGIDRYTRTIEGAVAQAHIMSLANLTKAVLASAITIVPFAAPAPLLAQYSTPQPYNAQDPQNYGAPAQQSYQQDYPQQQPQYGQPQQQQYSQQQPQQYDQQQQYQGNPGDDANYEAGQEAIAQAPPPIPQYDQPAAPAPGYLWTPGYWAFGPAGYYWVPGAWVEPPYTGALWTPGYWGNGDDGYYFWNAGYWGPTVGFYGGINYGFGYFGTGFYGGYWNGGIFFYNNACWRGNWGRYGYYGHLPEHTGFHPGGRSFISAREAGGLRGGETFGSHATIGAYRAGFGGHSGFGGGNGFHGGNNVLTAQPSRGFSSGYHPQLQPGGGGYNSVHGGPMQAQPRGFQPNSYRPGATPQPGAGYNGYRGAPPQQRFSVPQQPHYAAPAQPRYSAPAQPRSAPAQHFSAPSGGGGFHGGGGGGSSHGHR